MCTLHWNTHIILNKLHIISGASPLHAFSYPSHSDCAQQSGSVFAVFVPVAEAAAQWIDPRCSAVDAKKETCFFPSSSVHFGMRDVAGGRNDAGNETTLFIAWNEFGTTFSANPISPSVICIPLPRPRLALSLYPLFAPPNTNYVMRIANKVCTRIALILNFCADSSECIHVQDSTRELIKIIINFNTIIIIYITMATDQYHNWINFYYGQTMTGKTTTRRRETPCRPLSVWMGT